jgi:molecular chaperone GrpE
MPDEPQFTRQEPFFRDLPAESDPPQGGEPEHARPVENESETPDREGQSAPGADARLQEAERKAREHHDAWLRAKAEADNVRKRAQIDVANAHKYALEGFASDLLPVKDSLEATLAADKATLEALRSGVELTLKQLANVFEKASLKEINPVGEKFDPHRHQAISMLPSDREPNTVINVLQKGYLLNDRVIRPALVTVAKGRDA